MHETEQNGFSSVWPHPLGLTKHISSWFISVFQTLFEAFSFKGTMYKI